jgi:hypothetical protein
MRKAGEEVKKMKKEDFIAKYGEEKYKKRVEQSREYYKEHREELKPRKKKYREEHLGQTAAYNRETNRKGGKRYDKTLEYDRTGLRGERNAIRNKHQKQYRLYKNIIAPDSQLHHEWIVDTAEYRGVALVEATPHQYGIIDVIQILDGKITLLTEKK